MLPLCTFAQPGYIFTIAGNGIGGYSGDGGPATSAQIGCYINAGIAVDSYGNVYFTDSNRIRKIDAATGIITSFAGTGVPGYSGDGGPASNAQLNYPFRIHFDVLGNLYIADVHNYRLRKINLATGIISTVLGSGTLGFSPDGTLATNAQIGKIGGFAISNSGDIYYTDDSSKRVRKISVATGIITTVAGTGVPGFSGDGGPAVNAQFNFPWSVALDSYGNIYIGDLGNIRIRKVQAATGIITTMGGNGIDGCYLNSPINNTYIPQPNSLFMDYSDSLYAPGFLSCHWCAKISTTTSISSIFAGYNLSTYTGDGIPAVGAGLSDPIDVAVDGAKNIYIYDSYRIRKVVGLGSPAYVTDSFSVYINHYCSGPQLSIVPKHYLPTLTLKTWFGDGQTRIDSLNNTVCAYFDHLYQFSGTYTIKHVLYNGPTPVDSVSYPYTYTYCRTLPIRLYGDANSNCTFDSATEHLNFFPSSIEIDSNGIAIDTISVSSGYDYQATGNAGDIYKFKFLSAPYGFSTVCPTAGIIDTLSLGANTIKYMGYNCAAPSGFDLAQAAYSNFPTPFAQHGHILVYNDYCTPQNGDETITFSAPYTFSSASIPPASVNGNTVTWSLSNLSYFSPLTVINYTLANPLPSSLLPGTPISTSSTITPITGDMVPLNNSTTHTDIVFGSWDPNNMSVSPSGYIPASSTQLTYTFEFENTGNDTAQNIYVLDTISNYLDIHSLSLVAASHTMITSKVFNGTNWVMKFDFPNIKLLDSSHHNQCTGLAVFTIKTKPGLANGTVIPNRAGIYFDDNPVVLTNTVTDIIGTPSGITQVSAATVAPHIYPNPAHNELHIEGTDIHSIEITNLLGQVVLSNNYTSTSTTLNIESLQSGIYFVRVNGLYPYRLIKE
jgi:uncharacterized repeat protein (TIGR01451 family)